MSKLLSYDVAIIGGGLAGLSLSIQLARAGYQVAVFEKEQYPFHRVCGEYISLESWEFLKRLGVDPASLKVSRINKLLVTGATGGVLEQSLPLGGFGVSRYLLDHTLAKQARADGVHLFENTKITDVIANEDAASIISTSQNFSARIACAGFGKRSNLDVKWERPFTLAAKKNQPNYIGVKYHVQSNFPEDIIALHLFNDGYCGMVKIEGDKYNLCYLTTASNLRKCNGSIEKMEATILSKNPFLEKIFSQKGDWRSQPLTISQVSFAPKTQVEQHVLLVGDAAGMITPLCGNGMSMALHGSQVAAQALILFLHGKISRLELEQRYQQEWQQHFSRRLRMGRRVQKLAAHPSLARMAIGIGNQFPSLFQWMIRQTHGQPF